MKLLVVGQDFPWPPFTGSHLRLAQVLEAATSLGQTDLFTFVWGRRTAPLDVPVGVQLNRVLSLTTKTPDYSPRSRIKWMLTPGMPLEIAARNESEITNQFRSWTDPPYDLVWFSKATTYAGLNRPNLGPTIVDLDDLEDHKIYARLAAMRAESQHSSRFHGLGAQFQARLNAARWRMLQRTTAAAVDKVVLCSDVDIKRFSGDNAVVVQNGYETPASPLGRVDVSDPPTIMLQGSLEYGPNSDAARWLVGSIAPLIREIIPNARVRLVGAPDGSVEKLDSPPEVTVVGRVPEMETELAQADLVAVPLRYGSGTRVKILEAFAHRIPVVSTTIGAEGLELEADVHLLIADDPASFATACVRLLTDTELRTRLANNAHAVFLERFQWSQAQERMRQLMLETSTRA